MRDCRRLRYRWDQPSVTEALRFHAAPAADISHGRLVDLERMRGLAQPSR
jgi:hypothetical protein